MGVQTLMIFLGLSTAASGGFLVGGEFGRGTNRGVAQFQVEEDLSRKISRDMLCYPCRWNTASRLIKTIPDATLTLATLQLMATLALERCETGHIIAGDFDDAIFHLNALHKRLSLTCRQVLQRYAAHAENACEMLRVTEKISMRAEWVLAIITQETSGVMALCSFEVMTARVPRPAAISPGRGAPLY